MLQQAPLSRLNLKIFARNLTYLNAHLAIRPIRRRIRSRKAKKLEILSEIPLCESEYEN